MIPYIGPIDAWRRFMSGLPTRADHFLTDHSEWRVLRMTPWHRERLDYLLRERDEEQIRAEFQAITKGVRL
jgi:hypothetical protein